MTDSIKKGDVLDVTEGPRRRRRCTDVLLLLAFMGHIGVYVWTAVTGFQSGGNIEKLVAPRDYAGNLCGVSDQTSPLGTYVESFPKVYYTLNATYAFDDLWGDLFDSSQTASYIAGEIATRSQTFLASLVTDLSGNTLLDEFSDNFHAVCTPDCLDTAATSTRSYVWDGPSDASRRANWVTYAATFAANPSYTAGHTFSAAPLTDCPYDTERCITIFRDTSFPMQELLSSYCVPFQIDTLTNGIVTTSTTPTGWATATTWDFGSMMGDLRTGWPMLAVSVGVALIIGLVFSLVLRMCGGLLIWSLIFTTFAALGAGGATALLYSVKCTGESLSDVASRINEQKFSLDSACEEGFEVTDPDMRSATRIFSYVVMGLAVIYFVLVALVCKRIRLGIAVQKVAAQFVAQNKASVFVPLFQAIFTGGWMAAWLWVACTTVSQIPDDAINTSTYTTYADAVDGCGGSSKTYLSAIDLTTVPLTPSYTYLCKTPRYHFDWRICYQFFCLLWICEFFVAWGQTVLSGAVGVWYFSANTEKGHLGLRPIRTGLWNANRFHLGTIAFGALILAIVGFFKWILVLMSKQARATQNCVLRVILYPLICVIACIERFLGFLNKNCYIQTALAGTNFCSSCVHAVGLMIRNAARFGSLAGVSGLVNLFGRIFITAATAGVGWIMIFQWYAGQLTSPILLVIGFIIIGFFIGGLIMNIMSQATSTILQCFLIDEEVHKDEGGAKYTPSQLATFLQDH